MSEWRCCTVNVAELRDERPPLRLADLFLELGPGGVPDLDGERFVEILAKIFMKVAVVEADVETRKGALRVPHQRHQDGSRNQARDGRTETNDCSGLAQSARAVKLTHGAAPCDWIDWRGRQSGVAPAFDEARQQRRLLRRQ